MKFYWFKILLLVTVLPMFTGGIANATVIGYLSTCTITTAGPEFGDNCAVDQTTDYSYSLALPKFNSALGTLTGVEIYFYASETTTDFTVSNSAAGSETFDLSATGNLVKNFANTANAADTFTGETIQLFDTGIGTSLGNCSSDASSTVLPDNGCNSITLAADGSNDYASTPFTVANTDSNYDLAENPGVGLTTGTGLEGLTGVEKAGTSIADYEGSGDFDLNGATKNIFSVSGGGGNITVAQVTNALEKAEVDYIYTPTSVPEPATMGMFGTALIGLFAMRRKLRRS